MEIKNFKNFASQKPSFTSRIPLRLASPTSKNVYLENEHNIKMSKMLDVNERDYSDSYKSNDSYKHNYEDDQHWLIVQVHENERSSFNTKVQQLLHKDKKSKTPIIRNNTEKDWALLYQSNKGVSKILDENFFKDFPENSTYEIEGDIKTNKPFLFWAKQMNLKLIKGKERK